MLRDRGDGLISIASTAFCAAQQSVLSTSGPASTKTLLYTVNRKPLTCENPFRAVFAKRKEFYQVESNPLPPV